MRSRLPAYADTCERFLAKYVINFFRPSFEVVKEVRILLPGNFAPGQKVIFENKLTKSTNEQRKATICLPHGIGLQP